MTNLRKRLILTWHLTCLLFYLWLMTLLNPIETVRMLGMGLVAETRVGADVASTSEDQVDPNDGLGGNMGRCSHPRDGIRVIESDNISYSQCGGCGYTWRG